MARKNTSENMLQRIDGFVRARLQEVGFDSLTDNQRLFLCIHDLYWTTFEEYFLRGVAYEDPELDEKEEWNDEDFERMNAEASYWNRWQDCAVAGLRTIGANKAAKAFLRGQEGTLYDAQDEFRNAEDIEALLLDFVCNHPEDFQQALDGTA